MQRNRPRNTSKMMSPTTALSRMVTSSSMLPVKLKMLVSLIPRVRKKKGLVPFNSSWSRFDLRSLPAVQHHEEHEEQYQADDN